LSELRTRRGEFYWCPCIPSIFVGALQVQVTIAAGSETR